MSYFPPLLLSCCTSQQKGNSNQIQSKQHRQKLGLVFIHSLPPLYFIFPSSFFCLLPQPLQPEGVKAPGLLLLQPGQRGRPRDGLPPLLPLHSGVPSSLSLPLLSFIFIIIIAVGSACPFARPSPTEGHAVQRLSPALPPTSSGPLSPQPGGDIHVLSLRPGHAQPWTRVPRFGPSLAAAPVSSPQREVKSHQRGQGPQACTQAPQIALPN